MRRAKRMSMMVMAAALVSTLLAYLPAGAQTTGQEPCPEGTIRLPIDEGFVCRQPPAGEFFCPAGYVLAPVIPDPENPTPPLFPLFCEPVPPDSGGGGDGGGADGSGGGGSGGGGSGGGGSGGSGGGGGGGGATPITQESVQKSEAGELNQNFDVK